MLSYEQLNSFVIAIIIAVLIGLYLGFLFGKRRNNAETQIDIKQHNNFDINDKIDIRHSIISKMTSLREDIGADFLGLAIHDVVTDEIRWRIAVGASNSRYKRIVIRMGKGIAGEVIQLNRTIKIDDFPHDVLGDPIEYPILLVEYLKSVIAVPVANSSRIYGVLLIGQRAKKNFTELDEQKTVKEAQEIAKYLETANIYSQSSDILKGKKAISKEKINDSIFVQYLIEQQNTIHIDNRGKFKFEILDQSIIKIPMEVQKILIKNIEEILNIVSQDEDDQVCISIVRDENSILVECNSNRSIPSTKQVFESIYLRLGEIGGSIFSYHEKDQLHFVMQLPDWSYSSPLSN